ncbi:MAG: cytochrome P450 [Mycobacteriaceae bacterium]|nr:cytochrome P450 [Mycobacteriaceae bacterium]
MPAETPPPDANLAAGRCPVAHGSRKTGPTDRPQAELEQDSAGVWHVYGHSVALQILRSPCTRQAGFRADEFFATPQVTKTPVVFLDGDEHREHRRLTARFFTLRAVVDNYQPAMESLADSTVATLTERRRMDLSELALTYATGVVAQVLGLSGSDVPALAARLEACFAAPLVPLSLNPRTWARLILNNARIFQLYRADVRPAVALRRRGGAGPDDLISHLLGRGYRDRDILTEVFLFAAAGMVTTREFICVAAWHLLENPALRAEYLAAGEARRHRVLQETLRLEPVVQVLHRRATDDIRVRRTDGTQVVIAAAARIAVHTAHVNTDEAAAGGHPMDLCTNRVIRSERGRGALVGFGDGPHRCPGEHVAIQETDILLHRLMACDGVRLTGAVCQGRNDMVEGYELRGMTIEL